MPAPGHPMDGPTKESLKAEADYYRDQGRPPQAAASKDCTRLVAALKAASAELRRLHGVLTPHYEGKVAEPDLSIADEADAAIAAAS